MKIDEGAVAIVKPGTTKEFTMDAILVEADKEKEKINPLLDLIEKLREEARSHHKQQSTGLGNIQDVTTRLEQASTRAEKVTYTSIGITIAALIITFISLSVSFF
ncbi:MAG: hypothetical protein IIC67_08520 [Thaumarchaeota archaeon]|nr:hypothetical protein [Nitrososphaerota archaeon]